MREKGGGDITGLQIIVHRGSTPTLIHLQTCGNLAICVSPMAFCPYLAIGLALTNSTVKEDTDLSVSV